MSAAARAGGFDAGDVSPEKAVASRAFPVLLICGTKGPPDSAAMQNKSIKPRMGPSELWVVAGSASMLRPYGQAPAEYENRVVSFLENVSNER